MGKTFTRKSVYELPSIWMHIAGWALLITYETSFIYFSQGDLVGLLKTAPFYALNLSLFYVNYYCLNYAFSKKRFRFLWALIFIVSEFSLYLLLKISIDYLMMPLAMFKLMLYGKTKRYIAINLTRGIYFWILSLIYWSITRMSKYREAVANADKQKADLEKDLSDTRFAFYQQQINPHFLFNALNFIYNSVYKYSKEASNAVILLSDIMRYSLEDNDIGGKADLEKEVEQIQNLIEINRLRYDHELYIDFEIEGDYEDVKFIPLILLTFTENVFKYGDLKDENNPAKLKLTIINNQLIFETWNTRKTRIQLDKSTGIGLKNAVKRLEYTYNNNFELNYDNNPDAFVLKLKVNL